MAHPNLDPTSGSPFEGKPLELLEEAPYTEQRVRFIHAEDPRILETLDRYIFTATNAEELFEGAKASFLLGTIIEQNLMIERKQPVPQSLAAEKTQAAQHQERLDYALFPRKYLGVSLKEFGERHPEGRDALRQFFTRYVNIEDIYHRRMLALFSFRLGRQVVQVADLEAQFAMQPAIDPWDSKSQYMIRRSGILPIDDGWHDDDVIEPPAA